MSITTVVVPPAPARRWPPSSSQNRLALKAAVRHTASVEPGSSTASLMLGAPPPTVKCTFPGTPPTDDDGDDEDGCNDTEKQPCGVLGRCTCSCGAEAAQLAQDDVAAKIDSFTRTHSADAFGWTSLYTGMLALAHATYVLAFNSPLLAR